MHAVHACFSLRKQTNKAPLLQRANGVETEEKINGKKIKTVRTEGKMSMHKEIKIVFW
jgi:hypothetical protein